MPVILKHADEYCEYGEYCDAWQSAVTVIRSTDVAGKSCLEWLTRSYVIGDGLHGDSGCAQIKYALPACIGDSCTLLSAQCISSIGQIIQVAQLSQRNRAVAWVSFGWP